ncbi:sensor histidine kinase [Nonomuraea sediminis]|uniref:sensor histidine kinase n=1 Tax=Nonomuraea sediminis TaxID=2835864 RepID=UPI001BDBB4D4|nr:histidine kinase [Nonomuraea sediminis]
MSEQNYEPPEPRALILLVLMGITGVVWDTVDGTFQPAWLSWTGLLLACALYVTAVLSRFGSHPGRSRLAVAGMAVVVVLLGVHYGDGWHYMFIQLGAAIGIVLTGPPLRISLPVLSLLTAAVTWWHGVGIQGVMAFSWSTFSVGAVLALVLNLHAIIAEVRHTRQRLAEAAVAEERLRFSRDLHDLLGHTLSVIVVKAEAVRRLVARHPDQAAAQAADIEAVGRQALTEVREAVTGYRSGGLAVELDRAREALAAAGVSVVVRRTGPPLAAQAEALLGWVVREGVTNIIRHSGASTAEISLSGSSVTIRDNGLTAAPAASGGSGLRGLSERLAQAGGHITAGPLTTGGFELTATFPPTD